MQMLYTMGLAMVLALACFYADHWDLFTANGRSLPSRTGILPPPYWSPPCLRRSSWCAAAGGIWRRCCCGSRRCFLRQPHGAAVRRRDAAAGHGLSGLQKILPLWALFVILAAAAAIALLLGQQLHELFSAAVGMQTPSWSQTSAAGRCWRGRGRIFIGIRCWASAWAARKHGSLHRRAGEHGILS